jgi:hypothetical protein
MCFNSYQSSEDCDNDTNVKTYERRIKDTLMPNVLSNTSILVTGNALYYGVQENPPATLDCGKNVITSLTHCKNKLTVT